MTLTETIGAIMIAWFALVFLLLRFFWCASPRRKADRDNGWQPAPKRER